MPAGEAGTLVPESGILESTVDDLLTWYQAYAPPSVGPWYIVPTDGGVNSLGKRLHVYAVESLGVPWLPQRRLEVVDVVMMGCWERWMVHIYVDVPWAMDELMLRDGWMDG